MGETRRLVVVSNRVPTLSIPKTQEERRIQAVSGLVNALRPALEERGGMWFGWSGRSSPIQTNHIPVVSEIGSIQMATIDLSQSEIQLFYTVFANQTLWPLLHGFPERVIIRRDSYRAFQKINRKFAEALYPLLQPEDLIWIHDYHLLAVGSELRRLGWKGKLGFFLHVPFPPVDVFAILPWSRQLLEGLFSYDLVGLQTRRYARNLIECLQEELACSMTEGKCTYRDKSVQISVHPIGIDARTSQQRATHDQHDRPVPLLGRISPDRRVILGVERLDYTKGIPERLMAFEYLLEHYPSFRRKVSLVQISVPSRSHVPEYIKEKNRLDQLVGRINGRFAESDWLPVHHLYRSYNQQELAGFYRRADVCLVTPLRDGMNLVAKEFVACQGNDPGVLVLSRFCGAADTMPEALIINPYDIEGTAETISRALGMPYKERSLRWEALVAGVRLGTSQAWCDAFLDNLVEC